MLEKGALGVNEVILNYMGQSVCTWPQHNNARIVSILLRVYFIGTGDTWPWPFRQSYLFNVDSQCCQWLHRKLSRSNHFYTAVFFFFQIMEVCSNVSGHGLYGHAIIWNGDDDIQQWRNVNFVVALINWWVGRAGTFNLLICIKDRAHLSTFQIFIFEKFSCFIAW